MDAFMFLKLFIFFKQFKNSLYGGPTYFYLFFSGDDLDISWHFHALKPYLLSVTLLAKTECLNINLGSYVKTGALTYRTISYRLVPLILGLPFNKR